MKKWYKGQVCKGILIALIHFAVVFVVVFVGILSVSRLGLDIFSRENQGENARYENTLDFKMQLLSTGTSVIADHQLWSSLETDGEFDSDIIVDIMEFNQTRRISGRNESGIAYRLGDLLEWGGKMDAQGAAEHNILVALKLDGSFIYFYRFEFLDLIASGDLRGSNADVQREMDLLGNDMQEVFLRDWFADNPIVATLYREEEEIPLREFWSMSFLIEAFPPIGEDSILDIVNADMQLNGRLQEINSNLWTILLELPEIEREYQNGWRLHGERASNIVYLVLGEKSQGIQSNRQEILQKAEDFQAGSRLITSNEDMRYVIIGENFNDITTNLNLDRADLTSWFNDTDSHIVIAVDMSLPVQDDFYFGLQNFNRFVPFLQSFLWLFFVSFAIMLIGLIWLTIIAGCSVKDKEVHLLRFDHWKTELSAALVVGIWGFTTLCYIWMYENFHNPFLLWLGSRDITAMSDTIIMVFLSSYAVLTMALFLFGYLSLVRRIKGKIFWKNSILKIIFDVTRLCWKNLNVIWKTVVSILVVFLLHFLVILSRVPVFIVAIMLFDLVVVVFIILNAIARARIKKGIQEIAAGNVNYQIPLQYLRGDVLATAQLVNNIGNGLQMALEESLRSERMKTELITNVSHDIKTPLTSIINYIDLLKKENLQESKVQDYIRVLEEKANRLKTLTESVVEATRASSGNVTLTCMNINFVEMLQQVVGEFGERFAEKKLSLVANMGDESIGIFADGKQLWRVLDNVFMNVINYAMPGTRVYLDLFQKGESICFSLKNISEHPLNISVEELSERFIRGDAARTTEGSGLGLSIAKSLTELQGGKFELFLDGDLFKVVIEFLMVQV
ncbi:MAG: HAMP domain-containing histidine kinase [Lachnospiraceae bacterium]|nr:HAMP domain-containing histidine kinase [Lachnospiraceae bacterium]